MSSCNEPDEPARSHRPVPSANRQPSITRPGGNRAPPAPPAPPVCIPPPEAIIIGAAARGIGGMMAESNSATGAHRVCTRRPFRSTVKRFIIDVGTLLAVIVTASAYGVSPTPQQSPELKRLDVWAGNWTLSGTARDEPDGRDYSLRWTLHEHWVLNHSFLQVDQTWNGNGQTQRALEMLSYDPVRKVYTDSGFGSDGSTWSLSAVFNGSAMIETGQSKGPDGVITSCRMVWVFGKGGTSLSGRERCDKGGIQWQAVKVAGTKSR